MEPEQRRAPRGLVPRLRALLRERTARDEGAPNGPATERTDVVERLGAALREHDLDALVACFRHDYRGEQPLYPAAGTIDRDRLRRNWETFFGDVPDVQAELLASASSDDAIWTEWRIWGTRRDGEPMDLRSVWIFGVRDGLIEWGRLYREPIRADDETSGDDTVERLTRPE